MYSVVRNNILNYNLISENENIVVGVSGGPDSMALLYVLLDIRKEVYFNIIVAHVNHNVRGEEALADQLFVERKANELNLSYYFKSVDMDGYAKEMGITSEEAGRELRYGFFRDILKENRGGKIAVAHNKNDQAETLLLRIMRGTGIDGLKGMDLIAGDIIRPLLNISRKEIEQYIEKLNIEAVLDKTNLMPIYNRNKVRLELLPYIIENFNPNIINTLWRMSRTSNLDSKFLDDFTEKRYNFIVNNENKHSIILDGILFNEEDRSIQLRIIRKAILKIIGNLQGISETNITSLVDLFQGLETGKQLNLPNGIIGRISYNELVIEKLEVEEAKDFDYILTMGNNQFKELGISINITVKDSNESFKFNNNVKCFDYDKLIGDIRIRNRKIGDKFIPFGMNGRKKVKDYFIDKKIPKDLRDKIPLLVDDENIIWIIGYATSDIYKVNESTKKILIVDCKNTLGGID